MRTFGSRVNDTAKLFPDLDLVIMGDTSLEFRQLAALNDAFAESGLLFRVDVVDWATTIERFRRMMGGAV